MKHCTTGSADEMQDGRAQESLGRWGLTRLTLAGNVPTPMPNSTKVVRRSDCALGLSERVRIPSRRSIRPADPSVNQALSAYSARPTRGNMRDAQDAGYALTTHNRYMP